MVGYLSGVRWLVSKQKIERAKVFRLQRLKQVEWPFLVIGCCRGILIPSEDLEQRHANGERQSYANEAVGPCPDPM